MPPTPALSLETHVQYVKGIGPRIAESLKTKSILTVEDLLHRMPFRYEDRLHPVLFSELRVGEMASVIGQVRGSVLLQTARMPIFELTVGQNLQTLKCIWFHGAYLRDKYQPGQWVVVYGKVEASRSGNGHKMTQPQVELLPEKDAENPEGELLEVGRITPIYETLGGNRLHTRWLRKVMHGVLQELGDQVPETLPKALLERLGLPERARALREVHFPPPGTPMSMLSGARTPAQQRLIFEELFFLELGLELKRRKAREQTGIAFATDEKVRKALRNVLPFHPTAAQKKSLAEIADDMRKPGPMRRLLQGDVGSGKTIVAVQAMLIAIENGYQSALMAPTEILATQHYLAARKLLDRAAEQGGRTYRVVLLTGSLEPAQKRWNRQRIANGDAELIIGTHALIEDKVEFANLGLVVVDEQHRFGVMQRFRLMKKPGAAEPDLLAMTATPIPRTLALTLYGDLEVSILDELPPGRTPILTRQVPDERADEVWEFLREEVAKGHQAYIVYPVIEGPKDDQPELDFSPEGAAAGTKAAPAKAAKRAPAKAPAKSAAKAKSKAATLFTGLAPAPEHGGTATKQAQALGGSEGKSNLKSATEMYEELRHGPLHGLRMGLLHGRLSADDKEVIMRRFARGEIDVLVATTVIEVGVDVPNATTMVIEHAERFGLAQMHQLRGRVGRGSARSSCILMTGGRVSETSAERLAAMVRTQDGFELAELDLELRGPGEFFGTRQSGLPDFRVASLVRDRSVLEQAKREARAFVSNADAEATPAEKAAVWTSLRDTWQRRYGLVNAG
ncbi:ATP-dependent DNA helicase RecG [Acidipila sp. EB88]|uniref:ATP-dependent DNA helicase RecG n=1 Tax=Acidipila sp. EB88 TaxID=2305226 RepID=UPI000F5F0C7C|nr:ATP-dependent DNA helicase RecG [Acidipila sp. EB88]RRA48734.1 ATP-dependent DNA helicase RecG [Acidipila sp. EB88]